MHATLKRDALKQLAKQREAKGRVQKQTVLRAISHAKQCSAEASGARRMPRASVRTMRDPLVSGLTNLLRSNTLISVINTQAKRMHHRVDQLLENTKCKGTSEEGISPKVLRRCLDDLGRHPLLPAQRALAALTMEKGRGHPH